jgi:rfaE bifunctional protein kinase chain/domain
MTECSPLNDTIVESILTTIPRLRIGVLGDLFLDRYLDLDASLTEPSLETGLEAYQIVNVRPCPGAAGTVINNLVALGVGRIHPIAVVGEDGEGFELRRALDKLSGVDQRGILGDPERRTPTYIKPLLHARGKEPRELNRLDIKNRQRVSEKTQAEIRSKLSELSPNLDALVVLDQVSEAECGVITTLIREELTKLSAKEPRKFVLADSRERIGLFRGVALKPNRQEATTAIGPSAGVGANDLERVILALAERGGREVFCTDGANGMIIVTAQTGEREKPIQIPGYAVRGPIDVVGAGTITIAAIVCAMASGMTAKTAAAFGNLVASITIQQIGTTGIATPDQVRRRWTEVRDIAG